MLIASQVVPGLVLGSWKRRRVGPLARALLMFGLWIGLCSATWWTAFAAETDNPVAAKSDWWSLKPLTQPALPSATVDAAPVRNPIDAFIGATLAEKGLRPSPEADRRTLIRRLSFDLIGLPPAPEEIEAFVADPHPNAYENMVDRLLASPHYGERWARHWLDVVHFGETHGYDKDQPRPNAWPYRDYVIRSLNEDKPYARFVLEQLAGDVLFPGSRDGFEALGFISAGPWDLIGHAEVPESKIDGKIARHLDRDDMVATTFQTFNSLTVQCAQCHDHKFDPISQEDYYRLQAVFAAVDRADQAYDPIPEVARQRKELGERQAALAALRKELDDRILARAGPPLVELDRRIAALSKASTNGEAFGYHSAIEKQPDLEKWVQADLGQSVSIGSIVLHPCKDDFNGIGEGFGFPVKFKVEVSDDKTFRDGVTVVGDFTRDDFPNPKLKALSVEAGGRAARFIRVTATKLAFRQQDYIFALAELSVLTADGNNAALGAAVTALDSIEAPPRWRQVNLTDGGYPGARVIDSAALARLRLERADLVAKATSDDERSTLAGVERDLVASKAGLEQLPPLSKAYVGAVHTGTGSFAGTGAAGGKPRPIFVLQRGSVQTPGKEVEPGALQCLPGLSSQFELPPGHEEGRRRAALARWLVDTRNPLTWRTIVNRVWQYHFGRGLVETPNDFGRMGALPSHPELLDWLAAEFRDRGQSLKTLHRLIVTSRTYRQKSVIGESVISGSVVGESVAGESVAGELVVGSRSAKPRAVSPGSRNADSRMTDAVRNASSVDSDNRLLWRQNRRKLEAEAVRDAMLFVSGKLDLAIGGPSFKDFVVDKPEHSPHYEYHLHNPEDPRSHRRSIYRFIVRSQQQPFMTALDCADPSMQVARRNESVSPLQALAFLNNGLVLTLSQHFAAKLEKDGGALPAQVQRACYEALGRSVAPSEADTLVAYAREHGLPNLCRLLLNLNEFVFVD